MRNKVFVSFDYDNDRKYKYLLQAWDANTKFDFIFEDMTPGEINTNNIGRIKAGLTQKINLATHTLFIVGRHANQPHPMSNLIGFVNWINFEANKSIEGGNKLAVVKLQGSYGVPNELVGSRYKWITGYTEANVLKVLNAF